MSTSKPLPKVQLTTMLREILESDGFDVQDFLLYFACWKALGPDGENSDPYFGKDAYYHKPLRGGKLVVRHVHLRPESDSVALRVWERAFSREGRKTSDAALIYAEDRHHGYLLIDMVKEPNGHLIASMSTPKSSEMMNLYADVAEEFIHNGTILV